MIHTTSSCSESLGQWKMIRNMTKDFNIEPKENWSILGLAVFSSVRIK